jgi:hypothetical protein
MDGDIVVDGDEDDGNVGQSINGIGGCFESSDGVDTDDDIVVDDDKESATSFVDNDPLIVILSFIASLISAALFVYCNTI